ncbi:MAG: 50S ribosomal protein L6 [Myxococcota bacterium]
MSRIGKQPVPVPSGVTVQVASGKVQVRGPKGSLEHFVPAHVGVKIESGQVVLERDGDHRQARANHGLMRAIVRNMVQGVTQGFERKLEVFGVGYRAEVKGKNLVLNLGFSHPIEYAIPPGVGVAVDKAGGITVSGIDKQVVGQAAADIRSFRRPDAYKGKGVRYVGEYIRLKAGKSAK